MKRSSNNSPEGVIVARSESVIFRPSTAGDLDFVTKIEREAADKGFVSSWALDQHSDFLAHPDRRHLVIESVETGEALGFLLLAGIASPNRSIEFRRIVVDSKGRGIGRKAVRLLKAYVFLQLKAHRLWLDVKDFNERARALYHSEGFVEEGILRECLASSDGFESLVLMSMLESEYRPD